MRLTQTSFRKYNGNYYYHVNISKITNIPNCIQSQDKRINGFLLPRRGVQKFLCPCYCKTLKRVSFFTMNRLSSVMRERLMTTDFKAQTVVKFFSCCMVSKQILEKCYELGHIHKGRVFYIHIYGIYVYPFVYRFIHSYIYIYCESSKWQWL